MARKNGWAVRASCGRLAAMFAGVLGVAVAQADGGEPARRAAPQEATQATGASSAPPTPVLQVREIRRDLQQPWALAELPDGSLLVTQKGGQLVRMAEGGRGTKVEIQGVPTVAARGQGGLLDVALDPDFARTPWVYWSYAEPGEGRDHGLAGTAVARGRLQGDALVDVAVIYRQLPKVSGHGHFGSRLVFGRDGRLWVGLGDRQKGAPAQDLMQGLGKVMRLERDGRIPSDNPRFAAPAQPGLWSLGHRNIQGAALHPDTGALWVSEHGPQGGDEINLVRATGNHGWPLRSYGCPYGSPPGPDCQQGGGTHAPAFVEPLTTWVPLSIAPSGLAFYTGTRWPQWRGSLFSGALAGQALWRLQLDGERVVARERLLAELGERLRDVRQARDGALWLLTDSGRLLRVE